MAHDLLVVELWHAVARQLPESDARTLLSVSRTFRAVALRILFNSIVLFIGEPSTGSKRRQREESAQGILERIPRDEQLAHAVVGIRVITGDGGVKSKSKTIWQRLIVRALESLPHLRSFEWVCSPNSYTVLPKRVVATLIQSCPHVDAFTYLCSDRGAGQSDLCRLSGVRTLTYTTSNMDDVLEELFKANAATLRDVTVAVPLLVDLCSLNLSTITRLDIQCGFRGALLDQILVGATQLHDLSLYTTAEDLPVAPLQHHAMTTLRSLRLVGLGAEHVQPLAVFIARASGIRRLHLEWTGILQHDASWIQLLAALSPHLRVLGISILPLLADESDTALLSSICDKLPPSLRTLFVRSSQADIIFRSPLGTVENLIVHSYSTDMMPIENATSFVREVFTTSPALHFFSADFLPDTYSHHPGADVEHASSFADAGSGPDVDWLFPQWRY